MKNNLNDLLNIMKMHAKADRILQGYWLNEEQDEDGFFKGCFFGCAMQTEYNAIEKACEKYGLPLWIGCWSEKVFEGLPQKMALTWPVELLESLIAYSGDMESLMHKLAVKRLSFLAESCEGEVKSAIKRVIECHLDPKNSDWAAAEAAARSAAWSAWSAARSAASSAEAAAWSAEAAASSAARSAASSAEAATSSAAWSAEADAAAWVRERGWVLNLLDKGEAK